MGIDPVASPVPRLVEASVMNSEMDEVVAKREKATTPPRQACLRQLTPGWGAPASRWPVPPEHPMRVAPSHLAGACRTGVAAPRAQSRLKEVDWKKTAGKEIWVSRVEENLCERYYVRTLVNYRPRVAEVGEEAGQSRERGAALHNWDTNSSEAARGTAGELLGTPLVLCLVLADPCT